LTQVACEAEDGASFERGMLAQLQTCLDFSVGFFVRSHGVGDGSLGLDAAVVRATRACFGHYGKELSPVFVLAGKEQVAVDVEVLGVRTLQRTRVFREFMAPHGGSSTLLAPLAFRGRALGVLALGRPTEGFRDAELRLLRSALPTLRVCDVARARHVQLSGLTRREREVLGHLCRGYTNGEIALACATSVNTVRNQLRAVFRKLGASTRAEAVALAHGAP
jgi:DNA-binding CsgD family transcriptional regulator